MLVTLSEAKMRVLIFLAFIASTFAIHNYDHLDLVRLSLHTQEDHAYLDELIDSGKADPWKRQKGTTADVVVTKPILEVLKHRGMVEKVLITGQEITRVTQKQILEREISTNMTWTSYHTLDEINQFVDDVAAAYPEVSTVGVLTTSWEGREIKMITISNDTRTDSPIILVDSGIHAREWISPATGTYFLDQIVQDPVRLSEATYIFIPVLNVDGYQFTWDEDRLWRKTRSKRESERCYGTDPNRNFDFHWAEVGASANSCSDIYRGIEAASENLAQGLQQLMQDNAERIKAYITLHSYSQLMLAPYGYTTDPPYNMDDLMITAAAATNALSAVHGTVYEYGSASVILYENSGSSRDYAHGAMGVPYVYTIELRDTGEYGFELPEDQISDTVEETYEAFKVIVDAALASTV